MPSKQSNPGDADRLASLELELLADQLRHDASWLAAAYPPQKPTVPRRPKRSYKWVAVGAAAVLLLVAADAWWLWQKPSPEVSDIAKAPVTAVPATASQSPAAGPSFTVVAPRAMLPGASPPVRGYRDLNGAEKEALLDLLEQRPVHKRASHSL